MARCGGCGTIILWGGLKSGGERFCSPACMSRVAMTVLGESMPEEQLEAYVAEVRNGVCPRCGGQGPVDVHTSHSAMSFLVLTRWKSTPRVCCRRCGLQLQLGNLLLSAVVGWWGFPWGLVITPVQIGRNLAGMLRPKGRHAASEELRSAVRSSVVSQFMAAMTCPKCGYDVRAQRLAGIERCPECGMALEQFAVVPG